MYSRIVKWALLVSILIITAGCETVKGVGKDVANTASNIREVLRLGRDIKDISN